MGKVPASKDNDQEEMVAAIMKVRTRIEIPRKVKKVLLSLSALFGYSIQLHVFCHQYRISRTKRQCYLIGRVRGSVNQRQCTHLACQLLSDFEASSFSAIQKLHLAIFSDF